MRYSRQRDVILQELRSGQLDHPTAQEVHDAVRARLPRISLGTVYRNLRQLVEAGELRAVATGGALHVDTHLEPHAHFVCAGCGALTDLELDLPALESSLLEALGHRVEHADLTLTGRCARCLNQDERTLSIKSA